MAARFISLREREEERENSEICSFPRELDVFKILLELQKLLAEKLTQLIKF